MDKEELINMLWIAFLILIVVGVGLFAVVQYQKYYYNNQLLKNPCNVCLSENPEITCYVENKNNKDYSTYGRINWGDINLTTSSIESQPVDLYINIDDINNSGAIFSKPTD